MRNRPAGCSDCRAGYRPTGPRRSVKGRQMATNERAAGAWDVDRTVVRLPDPAIEVVDERFRALIVRRRSSSGCGPAAAGSRVRSGSATAATCSSPTSPTTGCCAGARLTGEVSRLPAAVRQQQRQHPGPAGPAGHLRAPAPAGSPGPSTTARSPSLHGRLRRQAAERAQRRRRALRRLDLVHRPGLGDRGQLRGRQGGQGAAPRRLPRSTPTRRRAQR